MTDDAPCTMMHSSSSKYAGGENFGLIMMVSLVQQRKANRFVHTVKIILYVGITQTADSIHAYNFHIHITLPNSIFILRFTHDSSDFYAH